MQINVNLKQTPVTFTFRPFICITRLKLQMLVTVVNRNLTFLLWRFSSACVYTAMLQLACGRPSSVVRRSPLH